MAIYFLNLKTFGRANGSSAVSAAAYRAGERIRDERSGRTYDHSARKDVLHKEIILPSGVAGEAEAWAQDRGLRHLTLHTGIANIPARRFYATLGFHDEEIRLTRPLQDCKPH